MEIANRQAEIAGRRSLLAQVTDTGIIVHDHPCECLSGVSSTNLNLIEQDHRSVKQRIAMMFGLKQFSNAVITIAGIELMHRIRKGQFGLRRFGLQRRTAPAVWNAVLRA